MAASTTNNVQAEATQLEANSTTFLSCLGFEGSRRNNLEYIEPGILIHACGNTVQFLNLNTNTQTTLPSRGGCGIGCIAVHPSKQLFAVCEKGTNPNVYIYQYPALVVHKVLSQGTEKAFSAAAFSHDGSQLATVGGHPDYWLTVWDWQNETVDLQSKAFSQDIFQVSFSKYFPGQLVTSGIGHIRFWKMANTFTGPKLEGFIGKFGQVPLSDICAYTELPDGKVLSGTETGTVLVWDGGLIKCQLKRPGGLPCHDGMIEFLHLDEKTNEMLTAGADGHVRFWSLKWLDAADDGDERTVCELNPLRELQVDEKCLIKGIIVSQDHWLIQDENGALWKVQLPSFEVEKVFAYHAGVITGLAVSPNSHFFATSGSDCSVRLFQFNEKKQIYARWFPCAATTIIWPSSVVDPHCATVVVGFSDGVIRVLYRDQSQWRLKNVKKPHTMDVTSISYSHDGEVLATGSLDGNVFFFHSTNDYKPLGYIKTPSPVTCIDWAPNGSNLLVGCNNGQILEVIRPSFDIDTKLTFELNLPSKLYTFILPEMKKIISGDNQTSDKQKSEEKGQETTKKDEENKSNVETQESETSKETESKANTEAQTSNEDIASDTNEEKTNEEEPSIPKEDKKSEVSSEQVGVEENASQKNQKGNPKQSIRKSNDGGVLAVRALLYTNSVLNTFYVALEGKAAGYIFECHIDMNGVMGMTKWYSVPIKCLRYSTSRQYIVSGHDDGVVRIQTAPTPGQLAIMKNHFYWEGRIHDCFNGAVGGAMISCDHQYLVSGAHDGSLYIHQLKFKKPPMDPIKIHSIPPAVGEENVEVDDIGLGVYSIEEDKQKTEEDNKMRIALQNKDKLKAKVEQIRHALAILVKANNAKEPSERVSIEEFEIDPNLRSMIEDEIQAKISEVKEELEWESEKKTIALSKLRRHFLDHLEVEHIVLHSFRNNSSVASFRTMKIDRELLVAIAEANEQRSTPISPRNPLLTMLKESPEKFEDTEATQSEGSHLEEKNVKGEDSAALQDKRRLQLKKMLADYDALVKSKEHEKFENVDDIAAIRYAEAHMGDFKLKSDLDYVRPINQQTNAKKKRNEMLLLKEAVFEEKMKFNTDFLSLRDIKRKIIKQIQEKNARIHQINTTLRIKDETLYIPTIHKDESPEDREIVTDKDIKEHIKYLKKLEEKELQKEKKGGLDFGTGPSNTKPENNTTNSNGMTPRDESKPKEATKPQRALAQTRIFPLSNLEQEEHDATQIKLKYEKSKLLEKIDLMIEHFDIALQEMRQKRFQLEINIKRADLKMIYLYQELKLLRSMQPKEEALESRHGAKMNELTDISAKIVEQEKLVEQKKKELSALNENKKQLMQEFEDLLGENHPAKDALLKIYQRKVKLSKNNEDEDEEDMDDMEIDDSRGSDDELDEDEVVEVCPPGCEEALYQNVCKLRERRTIEDGILSESNKQLDALQRERESKIKKKKAIESSLSNLEKEMADFQKEKQNGLNQIDAVLTLYMHQLEYLVDGALPEDLSGALVFSNIVIDQLKETIRGHGSETAALRKMQKDLRKEHSTLVKERKTRENKIEELEQRVLNVQMLKFGQEIDLNLIDNLSAKKDTEELRAKLRLQESQNVVEITKWNRLIDNCIDDISIAMKEHATCLNLTADIQENLDRLNEAMKQKASSPYRDVLVEKKRAEAEYGRLCKVVTAQKEHIDKLTQELRDIKKERRHIFP